MPEYVVEWQINISADNPREAAEQALNIMRNPSSTATVFDVLTEDESVRIDLEEDHEN